MQQHGNIDDEEMKRVFNLGIGYCVIVRKAFAESIKEQLEKLGEKVYGDAQAAAGAGAAGAGGAPGGEAKKDDGDVVDAEFTEVKDKKS